MSDSPDVLSLIQQRLDIDEVQARSIASVAIRCPFPGAGQREGSLGEFLASEHGAEQSDAILDIASGAREKGATPEEAIGNALGFAAIRDPETKELVRVQTTAPTIIETVIGKQEVEGTTEPPKGFSLRPIQ